MTPQTITLHGREYVVLPREEFDRLSRGSTRTRVAPAPTPPAVPPNERGNYDAIAYVRSLMARRLGDALKRSGLSQSGLAAKAKVRPETVSRLLNGRHTPDPRTWSKLVAALERAGATV